MKDFENKYTEDEFNPQKKMELIRMSEGVTFNDLPKDVMWLIAIDVMKLTWGGEDDWGTYVIQFSEGCYIPTSFDEETGTLIRHFALINKKTLAVVKSKCVKFENNSGSGWIFRKGALTY